MITIIMSAVIVTLAATTVYYRRRARYIWSMYQHQRDRANKAYLDDLGRWSGNIAAAASAAGYSVSDVEKSIKIFHRVTVEIPKIMDVIFEIYWQAPGINGAVDLSYIGARLHGRGITYQGKLSKLMAAHGYDVFHDPKHCGGIPCVVQIKTT